MAKKNDTSNKDAAVDSPASGGGGNAGRWFAIALLAVGSAVFLYASLGDGPDRASKEPATVASSPAPTKAAKRDAKPFRYHDSEEEARPFPVTLPPSHFRNEGIAHTYDVAKSIPGVLAQQPCLCGCDNASDDHSSLLDCFIDEHASTCLVCMKEAVLAEQMTKAGKSAQEIREAILRHDFSEVSIGN